MDQSRVVDVVEITLDVNGERRKNMSAAPRRLNIVGQRKACVDDRGLVSATKLVSGDYSRTPLKACPL